MIYIIALIILILISSFILKSLAVYKQILIPSLLSIPMCILFTFIYFLTPMNLVKNGYSMNDTLTIITVVPLVITFILVLIIEILIKNLSDKKISLFKFIIYLLLSIIISVLLLILM